MVLQCMCTFNIMFINGGNDGSLSSFTYYSSDEPEVGLRAADLSCFRKPVSA